MPDVSRSDSNRSDASRPRVSFNRNVHVKRINPPKKVNAYSVSMNGTTFMPAPIRESPMTKKEINDEAEVVLKHIDKVSRASKATPKIDEEKQKTVKKKLKSFSFLKKSEPNKKVEKTKNASSDIESSSSQEYRVYRINAPAKEMKSHILNHPKENGEIYSQELDRTKNGKKNYDFMSLDRKELKKKIKKGNLDYLSLEKSNEAVNKMKKEKSNRKLLNMVFDRMDPKIKKPVFQMPLEKAMETGESRKKISDISNEQENNKKVFIHTAESFGLDYLDINGKNNTDKTVKLLAETNKEAFAKNAAKVGVRELENDTGPDENGPFSYANEDKIDFKWKLEKRNAEDLGVGKDDLKSTSPTSDVIYAQVLVGKRDGNVQKSTVNERVSNNEVGSVFVGEDPNPSETSINYNINASSNDNICEIITVKNDENLKKKLLNSTKMWSTSECRGDVRKGLEESRNVNGNSPSSQTGNEYTRVVKVYTKNDTIKSGNKYPADLHDLSIRREILLSRSESQAKERFNSLKRLQEPQKIRRNVSNLNSIKQTDKLLRNETTRFSADETRNEQKIDENSMRKKREDEVASETQKPEPKKKKESKLDAYLKEKSDIWKNIDKVHLIKTDDDDDGNNLFRKLTRFGKSKSFEQDRPKNKKPGKMKTFFSKKDRKGSESEEDPVAARYVEYRGSDVEFSDRSTDSSPRRPTPKANLPRPMEPAYGFSNPISNYTKSSLRYFGDTDQESITNDTYSSGTKIKNEPQNKNVFGTEEDQILSSKSDTRTTNSTRINSPTAKFKSKCDLDNPDYGLKQMNHGLNLTFNKSENFSSNFKESLASKNDFSGINGLKFEPKIKRSVSSLTNSTKYNAKEKLRNLQSTPVTTVKPANESLSRRVKSHGNLYNQEDKKKGRRRLYDSSAESATEGDSSQNSSKSMIYLHAAKVGDIPGPRNIYRANKRSQSREELNSSTEDNSAVSPPGKKTLSRSFSVLAPWRPKHDKEDRILQYDTVDFNRGKPPTGIGKNKLGSTKERKTTELRFNTLGKENRRRKDLLR